MHSKHDRILQTWSTIQDTATVYEMQMTVKYRLTFNKSLSSQISKPLQQLHQSYPDYEYIHNLGKSSLSRYTCSVVYYAEQCVQ